MIRRFGVMSFGIGYFEDGVWIDHASGEATADPGLDDIHGWYGCCARGTGEPDGLGAAIGVRRGVTAEPWRAEGAPAGDAVLAN